MARPAVNMSDQPDPRGLSRPALLYGAVAGLVLQLALAVAGHFSAPVAELFPAGRNGIAALAGLLYGRRAGTVSRGSAGGGGALAAGASVLPALIVSYLLGDVPSSALAAGTLWGTAAGALGAVLGRMLDRRN